MTSEIRKAARLAPSHPIPASQAAAQKIVPPKTLTLSGNLDLVDPDGVVEGWCWSPDEPDVHRVVAVLVDGIEAARAICDETRADLLAAGVGNGAHAFLVVLPPERRPAGNTASIVLREVATGLNVGGVAQVAWRAVSDETVEASSSVLLLQGHLDGVTKDGRISGWCWYPGAPERHVRLQILVDDEIVGVASVANFRPDLQQAGIGDGTHAFSFALPWSVLAGKGTLSITVRDEETGAPFGAPILLRLGRLSGAEDRVAELERQIRLMRAQIEELTSELDSRADERPTQDMFATLGALFLDLARPAPGQDSASALQGWRGTKSTAQAASDPASLLRQAIEALKLRHPPFAFDIADEPAATIAIAAGADNATLYRCLRAIREAGIDHRADIVLIDDGRPGSEVALMPSLVRNVHLLHVPAGAGLAASLNELARTARGALLGYLDPRMLVSAGWLDEMVDSFAREPAAGLISSRVVGQDGLLRHIGLLAGDDGLPRGTGVLENATLPEYNFLREVDGVGALGFLVRQDALEAAGGFAGGYAQSGFTILDLCLRVRLSGRSVLLQPRATALCDDASDLHEALADLDHDAEDARRLCHQWFNDERAPLALRPVRFAGHALIIDNDVPHPDRDAGSIAALEQMQLLRRLGYRVTFAAAAAATQIPDQAAARLQGLGVELVTAPHYASVSDYLERHGDRLEIVQVYRYMNAAMFLERVRELAPQAKLIFSPADLHHLREMRHADVTGISRSEAGLRETRDQELHCVRHADATILTSDFELGLLKAEVAPGKLRLLRWITRPCPSPRAFGERSGICFIGNYRHGPNADGIIWFVQDVMPLLRAERAGLTLHIAGSEMTDEIRALAGPDVVVHGWVANLEDLFGRMRLSVAPLRFGAGFKGKVATSLAHGVPVVGSAIAMEGTGLEAGEGVAIADTAEQTAAEILRLHADPYLWHSMSAAALERCRTLYSPEAALGVYRGLLRDFGLPVLAA